MIDIPSPWIARVRLMAATLSEPLRFQTGALDTLPDVLREYVGQSCTLRDLILLPRERATRHGGWDEECLPAYVVCFNSGRVAEVFGEELIGEGTHWQALYEQVCRAFAFSRDRGYVGVADLARNGSAADHEAFMQHMGLSLPDTVLPQDEAERARALGFESVTAMHEHAVWLAGTAGPAYLNWVLGVVANAQAAGD